MAVSEFDVHIQNPAERGTHKMAKRFSAKQIKAGFGGKRRQTALKSKRRNVPKKRHSKAKRRNAAPKREAPVRHSVRKSKSSHRPRTKRRNPELVSFLLGNSAQRRKKNVAHSTKKKKRASSSHAGTRRSVKKHSTRRRSRGNPAGIPLKDFAFGGAGVLGGFLGSAALPQMILGSSNTGMTGYAVTAAAVIGLTILSHMIFPRQRAVTFGVGAGGAANLLRRIVTDQTPFGPYLSNAGMGDYMVANWGPPRMQNGLQSAMAEAPGTPWGGGGMIAASSGIGVQDAMDVRSSRPC